MARPQWLALAVFAFSCLLYTGTLRNDFVWDDRALVVENADIRTLDGPTVHRLFTTHYWEATGTHGGLYRPLTALSFYTDYQLWGKNPAGFHLTNLVLNGAVCTLAFVLMWQLFADAVLALAVSMLFASLPLHTENVAWVAGRTDVIALMMMLASLSLYAFWRRSGRAAALVLSVLAYASAVLAKEVAVVLPPLVLVLELGPFPRLGPAVARRAARAVLVSLPYFAVAGLFFFVRRLVLGASMFSFEPYATGLVATAALSLSILTHYCYQLVFPFLLNAESEFPVPETFLNLHTLVGLAVVIGGAGALWRWRHRGDVAFAASVFILGLAPVLNILPATEVSAERFLYVPSLGFVLLVATVAAGAFRLRPRATLLCLTLLIGAYSARTVLRTFDWHDESTLFQATVNVAGKNARAHLNLGNTYYRAGRYRDALDEYDKALEIDPKYAGAWNSSAGAHKALGDIDQAFACMQRALAIEPTNSNFHNSLGVLYVQRKEYAEAVRSFALAVKYRPEHARARYNLGVALYFEGDFAGAILQLTEVPHKDVEFVLAHYYLAESLARLAHAERAAHEADLFLKYYTRDDELSARARELVAGGR